MVEALHSDEVHEVIAKSPPWYKNGNLVKLYLLLTAPLLTSTAWGFDLSLTSGLQAVDQFMDNFGNPTGSKLGFFGASMSVGGLVACILGGTLADRFGRRGVCFVGAALVLGMALMQTFSTNFDMFVGSKMIIGFGGNLQQLGGPVLVSELAHPKQRVLVTSLYNTSIFIGLILGSWITYGTYAIPSNWSWKIPCLLQVILPAYQMTLIWFCPESPRWLVTRGRVEEARSILIHYHGNGEENLVVQAEMQDILAGVEADATQMKFNKEGISSILGSKGNRHRLWICFWTAVGSQAAGGSLIATYLPKILDQVGMKTSKEQTLINAIISICNWLTAFLAAFVIPRIKRRTMFLFSTINFNLVFVVWTALTERYIATERKSFGIAVVVMIFAYNFFQTMCWISLVIAYPLECVTAKQRGVFFAFTMFIINATAFVTSYTTPMLLDSMSWKYYVGQCVWNCVYIAVIYFTYVETSGMTLEEIAVVFDGHEAFEDARMHAREELKMKMERDEMAEVEEKAVKQA
ncbi:putative MFS hexose transporter [Macroventuria anomochaeta]|uniref:MFS hexose transporter n=1 Tax=Macroventuria anomochaeta TaxID=301207 RepID=A0ACB6RGU9_9PLEO|nr:putative MFS hexose transporter [Macroventuria anomochaeta]KAF2621078.1 putative MFS hexose transporter [Macroventuria anomochaeta]